MQPAAVKKHHGEEGKQISDREICRTVSQRGGVVGGNKGEVAQEFLELCSTQAVLQEENQTIGCDQQPCDDRRITRGHSVSNRDHVRLRLLECVSRMPGRNCCFASSGCSAIVARSSLSVRRNPCN